MFAPKLIIILLLLVSMYAYGEDLSKYTNDIPKAEVATPVEIRSIRSSLNVYDPVEHMKGQLRAGYIDVYEEGIAYASAFALAGHFHLYSKKWNGLMVGTDVYTILNTWINQNSHSLNDNFFNDGRESFILISQAYISGQWGNTQIKLGRQALDTPHANSDDIRMIPNFYTAYTFTNTDINNLTFKAGIIDKMAGWGNGGNSAEFIDVGKSLGAGRHIHGIYYASASYEGIQDLSLSLWHYHYSDIANVLYAELGYTHQLSSHTNLTLGLQYNGSNTSGSALLGEQDAQTFGISMETNFEAFCLTILAAYNQDSGDTGATGLSLGGGAFFTSMEDQTLDALATAGSAWVIGVGYSFEKTGMDGLSLGIAYGNFEADDASLYHVNETDAILEYQWDEKTSAVVALTSINHKVTHFQDYSQLRIIANYNF